MPRKAAKGKRARPRKSGPPAAAPVGHPSPLVDTRIIYCGDCLDQLSSEPRPSGSGLLPRLPDGCVDLKCAFGDRHASTQAYIDYMRPRCVELARQPGESRQS